MNEVDGRLIRVPASVPYGVGGDISGATAVQDRLHRDFAKAFKDGYVAVAVTTGEQPAYILTRTDRTRD